MTLIDIDAIPESATTISTDGRLFVAWSEIVKAPTIEAEPVKHGRWLNAVDEDPELYGWVPLDTVLCSVCRKLDKGNNRKTPCCPYCGAKMDLEA